MSSLVERLRVRSDSRPHYSLDETDDEADLLHKSKKPEQFKKIVRDDSKEDMCHACGESGNLLICETCTYEYHPKCLLPPLKAPLPTSWRCPKCVNPLNDIERILDCEVRPTVADDSDASKLGSKQIFVKQYLVKWKGLSYLHCTWVPEKEFIKAYKELPRLRTKVNNFHKQMPVGSNSEDDFVPIKPEYTMVDRIVASRQDDEEKEYLVKWVGLDYDECYWESESDILSCQQQIENFNRLQSRYRKLRKQKSNNRDATDSRKKLKDFQQFEKSPEFLRGGELHPYQLEGLNFLRFSWSKQTHVILADEMGLGKTIQSIAFLASLYEENVAPHIVVAPLSTLRNWEREFATWAPHMNVVMYVGTAVSRAVIREYEFYFPKSHKKDKKKKSSHGSRESKQERIQFDVLLTSYEMINIDNGSLKAINWETMIVDEGHRLKNKDSKLFSALKQFNTRHRTLLTGTPLLNNLDELFMLMHFLDAGKFSSLEEFQQEFKDINQEEQVSRLHKMLAPHLLRRVKKDVMKKLPPKKELILRVELSSKHKEYNKAILTRNYQILTRRGGAQIKFEDVKPYANSQTKVDAFLEFSTVERSFVTRQLVDNDDDEDLVYLGKNLGEKRVEEEEEEETNEEESRGEEEMTGESQMKVPTISAKRAAQLELARKGKEKRQKTSTTESGALPKTRMTIPREPSSKVDDSSRVVTPEKAKVASPMKTKTSSSAIAAIPISSAPPAKTTKSPSTTSIPSSTDKGKEHATGGAKVTKVNFTLPSDFMVDDVLSGTDLFPHLGKYLLPSFREHFEGFPVEEMGSHVAGLAFLAFQSSLALRAKTEKIKGLVSSAHERGNTALDREKVALEREEAMSKRLDEAQKELEDVGRAKDEANHRLKQSLSMIADQRKELSRVKESLVAKEKEVEDSKARMAGLEKEVGELKDEDASTFALARLTARAAIMRQHLSGKNPLALASDELAYFLREVGSARDLDSDDEKEAEEEEVDEGSKVEASGKDATDTPPQP